MTIRFLSSIDSSGLIEKIGCPEPEGPGQLL